MYREILPEREYYCSNTVADIPLRLVSEMFFSAPLRVIAASLVVLLNTQEDRSKPPH